MIYWFTGQPGAGKTTMAKELITYLNNPKVVHVDGDDLRDIFNNKDYSENGRRRNVERAQDIARFMDKNGYTVIVSIVSPYKNQRESFKKENNVIEILVKTDEMRGRENFGVKEYEPPTNDYIELDTTNKRVDESFIELIKYIDL